MYIVTMCDGRRDVPVATFGTLAAAYQWAVRYAGDWYITHRLYRDFYVEASWKRVC